VGRRQARDRTVTITEPATLITDYLLGAFTAVLAWRLFAAARLHRSRATWWWAVAFTATAIAGVAGGTVHGFRAMLPATLTAVLWVLTLECLLIAAFAVMRGTLLAAGLPPSSVRGASLLIGAAYAAYGAWLMRNPQFVFAIAAYGIALGVLAAVAMYRWDANPAAARWMLAGIGASAVAAAIQQSGLALHPHFNHNDLYHVVQAVGVWCLYRGAIASDARISRVSV
jgi:hypothetical protein